MSTVAPEQHRLDRLPDLVVARLGERLAHRVAGRARGHCVRVDSVRRLDAEALVDAVRAAAPADVADVHVLAEGAEAGPAGIPVERAVELRNRKRRVLVLLVPVGAAMAASSLDNSFERIDIAELLREVGEQLVDEVGDELAAALRRVARVLGRSRPVEAWARYVAEIVTDPSWSTLGAGLWRVGLVPDLGGPELVERLGRNLACARAISRPGRAVSSVADRLTVAELQEGPERRRIAGYLGGAQIDLSDVTTWARPLAAPPHAGVLSFERWPLAARRTVEVASVRVDPFLKEDGGLRAGTQLSQDAPGELPYTLAGDGVPARVTVAWRTDPVKTDAVHRWQLAVLAPDDLRGPDTEPILQQTVKGTQRRSALRLELGEEDLDEGALFVVRLTALDEDGQPVLLRDGSEAVVEGQQFAVRWNAEQPASDGRRATAPALARARLDAALDGHDDHREDAPTWHGGRFSLRLGGKRSVTLALSPALVEVQRRTLNERGKVTAWEVRGRRGEVPQDGDFDPEHGTLPPALAERRRKLFDALRERQPRDVVETLAWDDGLRAEVIAYCQAYRRALEAATAETKASLLSLDTVLLSVDTAGHASVAAVIVLPLHPLRLAWAAEYDATLTRWAAQLAERGKTAAKRRHAVDPRLLDRVTPANLPFVAVSVEGQRYVHAREATLGTGIYLNPGESEPGAAIQAVFDVLGLDWRDVPAEFPAALLAERLAAYRAAHPGQDVLRLIADNAGSGELLASALRDAVLRDRDEEESAEPPARLELTAYSRRPALTDPIPALTDLQRSVAAQPVVGPQSHLIPPLGLSVRPHERLVSDRHAAHAAVIADVADIATGPSTGEVSATAAAFGNLLSPAISHRVEHADGRVVWQTVPATRPRGRDGVAIVEAHGAYLAAMADGPNPIVLTATLGPTEVAALHAAHARSDWVLTLDRHLGVDFYTARAVDSPYILDYAPDFVDGLGPRLTVTTTYRDEVERLLAKAMSDLELATPEASVRSMLDHLQVVSGRLALRLVARSSLATEAVSLAALIAYLRRIGRLDGAIVVPVDTHQEVFGDPASGKAQRRCDLVLVHVTARTMRLECVEVKSRQAAVLSSALVDTIVDQVDATAELLADLYFRTDPPRIDVALQLARLGGVLRYHADRAHAQGLMDVRQRGDAERMIERLEDGAYRPEISRRGYVVSLDGRGDVPVEHRGVRIDVLTATELAEAGLESVREGGAGLGGTTGAGPVAPTGAGPAVAGPPPEAAVPVPGVLPPESTLVPPAEPTLTASAAPAPAPTAPAATERIRPRPSPFPRPGPVASTGLAPTPPDVVPAVVSPDPGRASRPEDVGLVVPQPDPGLVHPPGATELVVPPPDPAPPKDATSVVLPPDPGPVQPPEDTTVKVVLGRDSNGEPVPWRISTKGSPHLFVLGLPGQGKSVTTRRILNAFAEHGLPALVVDFHGDMAAEPAAGAAVLDATRGLPISPFELDDPARYREASWELSEVIGYVCGLGEIQRNAVYEGVRSLYEQHGYGGPGGRPTVPTMMELGDAVTAIEGTGRSRNVAARLRPLTDFGLFADADSGTGFADLLRAGVVLDLHGLMEQVQLAAAAFTLRKIYREMFHWGRAERLRLAIVLDEAHRLAHDVTLPKIMKEGRKYGVAVVVASQGVADFHRDVLANAGTKVAFRCNYPQSRTVAGFLRGRAGQDLSEALERLGVGQAYVSTPDHAVARKVFMARD